jgi:hypothetical protein
LADHGSVPKPGEFAATDDVVHVVLSTTGRLAFRSMPRDLKNNDKPRPLRYSPVKLSKKEFD